MNENCIVLENVSEQLNLFNINYLFKQEYDWTDPEKTVIDFICSLDSSKNWEVPLL